MQHSSRILYADTLTVQLQVVAKLKITIIIITSVLIIYYVMLIFSCLVQLLKYSLLSTDQLFYNIAIFIKYIKERIRYLNTDAKNILLKLIVIAII